MERKQLKIGVRVGGGPPPGYCWDVGILDFAHSEALKGLNSDDQFDHIRDQVRDLASANEPTLCPTLDVRSIENYYELRDKGGVLGNLNVRVFFHVDADRRCLIVLGFVLKKNDGPTLVGDKGRMRRRLRKYLNGDYGYLPARCE